MKNRARKIGKDKKDNFCQASLLQSSIFINVKILILSYKKSIFAFMKIVLERIYLELIASKKKLPFCFSKAKSVTINYNNLLCISRSWNNVQGCGGCCFLQYCERALEVGEFLPVAAEASLFHSLPVDQKGIYFPKLGAQVKICLTLTFPMQAFLFVYRNK